MLSWAFSHDLTGIFSINGEGQKPIAYYQDPFCKEWVFLS